MIVSCHTPSTPSYDPSLQIYTIPPPQPITFRVDSVYPHDSFALPKAWYTMTENYMKAPGTPTAVTKPH